MTRDRALARFIDGYIHSHPEIAVPALIDAVKEGHFVNSIWALGEFGADAKSAIRIMEMLWVELSHD